VGSFILAAKGHYAQDMRDIPSMGVLDPDLGGEKYHQSDWLGLERWGDKKEG
jgi:hypothetical protein